MRSRRLLLACAALGSGTLGSAVLGCGVLDTFSTSITDEATIPGTYAAGMPFALMYGGSFKRIDILHV